jgi:TetR/AcrR family transcriptional regulator, transcriptional repressor for nem operon
MLLIMNAIKKWIIITVVNVSKEAARKNHETILNAASVSVRKHGAAQTSVAQIANAAGLTHGALYRHFPDKDTLVAAAIESGFNKIVDLLEDMKVNGRHSSDYIKTYLDQNHRDYFVWGCPAAPLAAEISRLDADIQSVFYDGLTRNISALAELIGTQDVKTARNEAMVILSTLVGAMALARATKDTDLSLSNEILAVVKQHLTKKT